MQPDWWSTKYAIFRNFIHNVGVITTTKGKIFVNHEKKEDCKGKNPKLITDQTFTKQQKLVQDAEKKKMFNSLQYQETVYISTGF